MDDRRFDSLTRMLASGASRRAVLRSLLGLGGAITFSKHADARSIGTRPTLPPPPPPTTPPPTTTTLAPCPGQEQCPDSTLCCPTGTCARSGNQAICCDGASGHGTFVCGLECCDDGRHCCDGECCTPDSVCLTRLFPESDLVEEEVCCHQSQACDNQCCDGTCFFDPGSEPFLPAPWPWPDASCCPALVGVTYCPGQGEFGSTGACCSGATPDCCHDADGRPVCLTPAQCCSADECPDRPEFCEVGVCLSDFTCGFVFNCESGEDCCKGGDNTCCADPNTCCGARCCTPDTTCCGDACCDPGQCNEIEHVCCPAETHRCGTGEDTCCPDDLQCCSSGKVCGECCDDDDCSEIVDFPNCKRSRCDFATHTCQLYDVCEAEGRTCCPGDDVGFCYAPDDDQCCTNDDCPGCDVCLHPSNTCRGSCPGSLSCCDSPQDPDNWFCYPGNHPELCSVVCADDSDCANVNDFPNCQRSRCNELTASCVYYDVCEEEGRTCCPQEEVGYCYSTDDDQCCTNDDCPGCDVCLHPSNTCRGDCPGALACCEHGDDADLWFCYPANHPELCQSCASDSDCPGECHTCSGGICSDTDALCFGDCGVCDGGTCFPDDTNCPGCQICAVSDQYECVDSDDECSGDPNGGTCCNAVCGECCEDGDCTAGSGETCTCQNRACVCEPDSTFCERDADCATIPTYCETQPDGDLLWRYHLCSGGGVCTLTAHLCNFANHVCERNTCGAETDCGVENIPAGELGTDGVSICCDVDNDCASLPRFCDNDDLWHYHLCDGIVCRSTARQCGTGQCNDIIGCEIVGQ